MTKTTFKAWFFLFRPWSYIATLVPFLVAAGCSAFSGDVLHWGGGIVSGLFFQAAVNLLNTWGDERSGVDAVPGAIRTTPQVHEGLVSMRAVLAVALACAFIASSIGVALCFYQIDGAWRFNEVLFCIGIIGCLGALNYSTGVKFKYHGLGVPFVSFLMGPLEMLAAFSLLNPNWRFERFFSYDFLLLFAMVSLPVAALVGVIMHGNDMRDIPSDRAAGIVTLASRLGPKRALVYYWFCHVVPYVAVVFFFGFLSAAAFEAVGLWSWFLLPLLCLPLTVGTLRAATSVYRASPENPPWRGLERGSGRIHLVFGVLYALSLFLVVYGLMDSKREHMRSREGGAAGVHERVGADAEEGGRNGAK